MNNPSSINTQQLYIITDISCIMACSKYQYVKKFEETHTALLQTYIVVRIDGRGFTKFCAAHNFSKPNDLRAIKLMNAAAQYVCNNFTEIFLAYGQSDQYSFVFNKNTTLFSRRIQKILSCVGSAFTSAYIFNWPKYFEMPLKEIPTFDSRIVTYPNETCIKDYFRWRQVDCHINNLYNTIFWEMVNTGKSNQEVELILKDTNSGQKNQILFTQFGINYNNIEEIYRRGTLLYYLTEVKEEVKQLQKGNEKDKQESKHGQETKNSQEEGLIVGNQGKKIQKSKHDVSIEKREHKKNQKVKKKLIASHEDCIKEQFWLHFFK